MIAGDIVIEITKIAAGFGLIVGIFRFLVGKRPLVYMKIGPPQNGVRTATLHVTNNTGVPMLLTSARVLLPRGTSLGIQQYRNDSADPADPIFAALPVVYSVAVSFGAEITGGDHTFPVLVKDCGSDSPIILLNIVSARSMIRIAPMIVRALHTDDTAMNA